MDIRKWPIIKKSWKALKSKGWYLTGESMTPALPEDDIMKCWKSLVKYVHGDKGSTEIAETRAK